MNGHSESAERAPATPGRVVVIGVGNDHRGDDGVGLEVARRLRDRNVDGLRVATVAGEATRIMQAWQSAHAAVIVDAVSWDDRPGAVHRFDARRGRLPSEMWSCSSHHLGVAEAIELARALGQLPPHLVIYAVSAESFDAGATMSPAVRDAVDAVACAVIEEVERYLCPTAKESGPR